MGQNRLVQAAFVSTNSITQGEQVAVLWSYLLAAGVQIRFAHRSFKWSNEGKGNAAVHCVIVGFGLQEPAQRLLFDQADDPKSDGKSLNVLHINPYLVDGPNILLEKRRMPATCVPVMIRGSSPIDGGNLLLSEPERLTLLAAEPRAQAWIRPYLMGDEFINNIPRWCLWLVGISPTELRAMPEVYKRVQAVKAMRLASSKLATQESAATPYMFGEIRQPSSARYLAVPKVSSERRTYVPIGYLEQQVVCGDKIFFISDASLHTFALLTSSMHNAWMRAVCGRLKSDYSYSNTIVYNNFPWPEPASLAQRQVLEAAAQAVLDARQRYPNDSLAALYDPDVMPVELLKAHLAVDRAVDAAYGYTGDKSDPPRVAFLFTRYQHLTSLLPVAVKKALSRSTRPS
jgi:hypothetical protein